MALPFISKATQAPPNAGPMTSDEPLWISAPVCISARRGQAVLIEKKKGPAILQGPRVAIGVSSVTRI